MTLERYFHQARELRYSLLFALPLLLLYEGLATLLSGSAMAGVRNGADVLVKTLFVAVGGPHGLALFGFVLLGTGGWFAWRDHARRGTALRGQVFAWMLLESILLAMVFGQVVAYLTSWLLYGPLVVATQGPVQTLPLTVQLVVSLGAGIYEELLFRVLLVSGILWLGLRLRWRRSVAIGVAIGLSALIFSAFHYIGPFGDQLTAPSFVFRLVAGVLLSGLYVARGLGITAWTHALYDVGLALAA